LAKAERQENRSAQADAKKIIENKHLALSKWQLAKPKTITGLASAITAILSLLLLGF
jgi:hypothetical protein